MLKDRRRKGNNALFMRDISIYSKSFKGSKGGRTMHMHIQHAISRYCNYSTVLLRPDDGTSAHQSPLVVHCDYITTVPIHIVQATLILFCWLGFNIHTTYCKTSSKVHAWRARPCFVRCLFLDNKAAKGRSANCLYAFNPFCSTVY